MRRPTHPGCKCLISSILSFLRDKQCNNFVVTPVTPWLKRSFESKELAEEIGSWRQRQSTDGTMRVSVGKGDANARGVECRAREGRLGGCERSVRLNCVGTRSQCMRPCTLMHRLQHHLLPPPHLHGPRVPSSSQCCIPPSSPLAPPLAPATSQLCPPPPLPIPLPPPHSHHHHVTAPPGSFHRQFLTRHLFRMFMTATASPCSLTRIHALWRSRAARCSCWWWTPSKSLGMTH
jgi:hypothetical protein